MDVGKTKKKGVIMLTISENTSIVGSIRSAGTVQISGKIKGDGVFEDLIVIAPSCHWEGNIVADSIIVEGTISGNIIGRKDIKIASSAKIIGDITTPKLTIAQGAKLDSNVRMQPFAKPIELNDQKNKKLLEQKAEIKDKKEKKEKVKQLA